MLDNYFDRDLLDAPLMKHGRSDSYQAVISSVHQEEGQAFITAFDQTKGIWFSLHGQPNSELKPGRAILAKKANEGQTDLLSPVGLTMFDGQSTAYRVYVND